MSIPQMMISLPESPLSNPLITSSGDSPPDNYTNAHDWLKIIYIIYVHTSHHNIIPYIVYTHGQQTGSCVEPTAVHCVYPGRHAD